MSLLRPGASRIFRAKVAERPHVELDLAALKKKLGWSQRSEVPSVWFMAKKVGEERTYKYLYQATSRSVHFNVHELMRRCWGRPGKIVLDSNQFERYWARCALSWGVHLYIKVLGLGLQFLDEGKELDDAGGERILGLAKKLGAAGTMPIITAEELKWPW